MAGIGFGVRQYLWGLHHVSTDNAQVEGHLVPVIAKISGYVTGVGVEENQNVRAGDLLVQIDDREYRAKLAQSDADLAAALATAGSKGRVGQAVAQVAAARAAVAQAQANSIRAQQDVERYRTLAPSGVVSRQQLDAAEASATSSAAQLDAAQKQVQAAEAGLQAADARTAAVRAQRDQAELNLDWARMVAPRGGVVSRKTVEPGQLVSPGQPLMSIVPLDDVWIVANLKETEIRDVTPGDRAEIQVDAYPGRRFAARVESVSAATGAKFSLLPPDNATGNFTKVVQRIPVRLRLAGPQDPAHWLRPGMSVTAVITTK
jgi:membrane fusion protein (multidrug efflux system)